MKQILTIFLLMALTACTTAPKTQQYVPEKSFNADSAYAFVEEQVSFGPRVPGTAAHQACVDYLTKTLARYNGSVRIREGEILNYAGQKVTVRNIEAHYGESNGKRILLCAHYDSRPWADMEEDYEDRQQPILGANDGASGVGVLLELARLHAAGEITQPFTIVFFDYEDMGTPYFYTGTQREDTWCLGAQIWAKAYAENPSVPYKFGILLDMVGDPNVIFPREYFSMQYARQAMDKIWHTADQQGYRSHFVDAIANPITDDHYYVNTIAHIPCIDIIHYDATSETGFPWWWHTHNDNLDNISRSSLQMTGDVLTQCLK